MPKWYYQKTGRTYGPWAIDGIKRLLAGGSLSGEDLIWADGTDPSSARAINDILAASQPARPTAASGLPDWVRDVAEIQSVAPTPPPASNERVPDWVEDVRKAEEAGGDMASAASSDIEQWALDFQPPPVQTSNTQSIARSVEEVQDDGVVNTDGALTSKQRRKRAIVIGLLTGVPFWIFVIVYLIYLYLDRSK
jgi:hypothetical protein